MQHEKDIPPAERRPSRNLTEDTIFDDTLFKSLRQSNYAVLADLMGANRELAIFRKFDALNMLVLLSLQAELLELARSLEDEIVNDEGSSATPDQREVSRSFLRMRSRPEGDKQWQIILALRRKLHEYRETMLEVAKVSSLQAPYHTERRTLRQWLMGSLPGEGDCFMSDVEGFTWDERFDKDLVSLNIASGRSDIWSSSIINSLVDGWDAIQPIGWKKPINRSGMVKYRGLKMFSTLLTSVLAAALPALSTIPLHYTRDLTHRIAIMVGFTVTFALILTIFTTAKRVEIFSATAAFAAVEVIFIGTAEDLVKS